MTQVSRRRFLELVGAAGGSGAMYRVASAMGIMAAPGASPLARVAPLTGKRRKVVILGAGISGLTAAYELGKAGYDTVLLESSHRAGGRNMTLRHGDVVDELGQKQVCQFDDDPSLYFNAGPARIPQDHTALVGYCRELGVQLEVWVNDNRNAYIQDDNAFGGKPVRQRQYVADARGFMAEILAKSVVDEQLAAPMDTVDVQKVLEFAKAWGDLGDDYFYRGSERAGYKSGGFVMHGELRETFDFEELMKASFWRGPMHFGESNDQASTMMTPTGGMDRVVAGFMRKVGDKVRLNAWVKGIELKEDGVEVTYQEKGELKTERGDFCINCIPTHLVVGLKHNFPSDYALALTKPERGKLFKIGLQAKERFWEKDHIYGGISWTAQPITQIWYPNHSFFAQKGIVLGAYTFFPGAGEMFTKMTPEERFKEALRQGEKVHPGYSEYMENGVSVAWHRMNHMMGCSARWPRDEGETHFKRLQAPAGRHYMVGDQISYHSGWQEGAIRSAHLALADIDRRVQAEERGEAVTA
ncbi:MAG: FAD-dependent oxidoreductase [Pseudomonadales bacterium]|jgi:monoamine oxidase|nr:FAD-dependent oxidoreductase [Pseudomonadales bacterium]